MRLSTAVASFLADGSLHLSARTVIDYGSDLGMLVALAKVKGADNISAFDDALVREYLDFFRKRDLSPITIARRRTTANEFGKWGVRERLWATNPVDLLPKAKRLQRRLPRPFQADEMERLNALNLPQLQRVIRALLYYTGLRITPICQLRLRSLSFAPIKIDGDLSMPGSIRSIGKGDKEFVTGMHPDLRPILYDYVLARHPDLNPESYLLTHPRSGKPLRPNTVERWVSAWGRQANVQKCTPHRFRHSFATLLLQAGVRIERIQSLLAHANIATTMIYTKVMDQDALSGLLKLPSATPAPPPERAETPDVIREDSPSRPHDAA